MTENQQRTVTDAETLKAVTHPLRAKILGTLRILGPATASELGRRFGESSGSTSYHLRVLAKYGYVEPDPEQPNARDKRWRAVHMVTSWNNADFHRDPVAAEAARAMRRGQLDFLLRAHDRYEADMDSWGPVWQRVAGMSDRVLRLRAESLGELQERVDALITEYEERDRDASGTELTSIYLASYPFDESQID